MSDLRQRQGGQGSDSSSLTSSTQQVSQTEEPKVLTESQPPANSADAHSTGSSLQSSEESEDDDPSTFGGSDYAEEPQAYRLEQTYTHFTDKELVNPAMAETSVDAGRTLSRMLTNADDIDAQTRKDEAEGVKLPPMGGGRELPPALPNNDIYTVTFEGKEDPLHPFNWPTKQKVINSITMGCTTFCIAFGSAIFSAAVPAISEKYHVANVVSTLGITLYVFGFATGPVIWAPLSELYGRRPVIVLSTLLFTIFIFAVACSDRLEAILICRFFAGCLGAAPMVVVPATQADMFDNHTRGTAIVIFSMAVFVGPMVAPFVGAFIAKNPHLGWRWTQFIVGILGSASLVAVTAFQNESHHQIILLDRARELRRRTGIWGIHCAHEEFSLTLREIVEKNLTRPLYMLFTEPILLFITVYNAFVYGMMYLMLTAYPIIFQEGYGMAPGVAELPYIGLILGMLFGGVFCIYKEKSYNKMLNANDGKVVPEARLPTMLYGAIAFPIGILWLCWTGNYPDKIHWMCPTASGIFTGFGSMAIFIPSMNYIIDCYLVFSASAMAANCFLRSAFGGAFPLFATFMFEKMGTNWAGLLLGLFGFLMVLFPVLFIKYGQKIRTRSKYAIHDK